MSRAAQLTLPLKPRRSHGGRREGAGRPKTSKLQPHAGRARFHAREPLHLTIRLADELPSLRRKDAFRCLRDAVAKARKQGLAIIHFSILSNHAHFIAESGGKEDLSRQMQSLAISLSKRLNSVAGRTGAVFRERYHVHVLKTPTEVKNALRYVLTNEYRHLGSTGRVQLDAYSSAIYVEDSVWERLLGKRWRRVVGFPTIMPWGQRSNRHEEEPWVMASPRTWLLSRGWARGTA